MKSSNRDPRFELIRLCAIAFVVAHHVLLFGVDGCGYLSPFEADAKGVVCVAANSVVVTGVNLFVMISGWFGIRRVWRPVARLVVECAVFGAVALALSLGLSALFHVDGVDASWAWSRLCHSVKFTNWWFVTHYLMLVLLSPLLERALKDIGRRDFEVVLLAFGVFTFVFGFGWGFVNASGYNVLNFVMLYLVARYMRLFPASPLCRFVCGRAWLTVLVCAGLMAVWFLCDTASWQPGHSCKAWNYNCPLVVAESMAIFSLLLSLKPTKWNVAALSPCVLGIYLLQSSPDLVLFRNALGSWLWRECGFAGLVLAVAALLLVSLLLSAAVTAPLRFVLRKAGL